MSFYRACLILGVVFILSSLCIVGKAVHDLVTQVLPEVVSIKNQLNEKKNSHNHNETLQYSKQV